MFHYMELAISTYIGDRGCKPGKSWIQYPHLIPSLGTSLQSDLDVRRHSSFRLFYFDVIFPILFTSMLKWLVSDAMRTGLSRIQ